MPSPIDAIGSGSYATANAASAGQVANLSRSEQLAELNQLLYRYQVGISRGESAEALASLAMLIAAAEESLGLHMPTARPPPARRRSTPTRRQTEADSETHRLDETA